MRCVDVAVMACRAVFLLVISFGNFRKGVGSKRNGGLLGLPKTAGLAAGSISSCSMSETLPERLFLALLHVSELLEPCGWNFDPATVNVTSS